jgi:hypothetical protein
MRMKWARYVSAIICSLTLSLPACTTSQTSAPKFDLVTTLVASWAGQHGTLRLGQDGEFTLQGREAAAGGWTPTDAGHFEISQPTQQTCAYALDGDRLLITGCSLAGEYFRVRE